MGGIVGSMVEILRVYEEACCGIRDTVGYKQKEQLIEGGVVIAMGYIYGYGYHGYGYHAACPPSIRRSAPVMNVLASLSRKMAAPR